MSSPDSDTVEFVLPPASMQVVVDIGAATNPGCVRPNNEDSYLIVRASRSLETLRTSLPEGSIPLWSEERSFGFIVADGMGGHAAGEIASQLALRTVIEHVLATADWIMRDPAAHTDKIEERIAERFSAADEAVHEQASQHPLLSGMGTTMTLAVSMGTRLFLGHVGDSRAYLLRGGQLQVLTRDHSMVQTLADAGVISREEAATHRMRNVLLRSLGGGDAKADVRHMRLETDDQLLLCTDGLNEMVPEPMISDILQSCLSAQATCDQLISAALAAGGKDNVTVVLAKYGWLT